jgi:hypothetical protein
VVVGGFVLVATADAATAEIDGDCDATLDGEDVGSLSSTDLDDVIEVDAEDVVTVGAVADQPIDSYVVDMEFAGASWQVASGNGDGNTWTDEVDVADYARYGVGVYRVSAVSTGAGTCTGAVLVAITGKSPFTTPVGIVASVITVGGVGLISSALIDALRRSAR